jgi:alkanesulfonate monooxygenase SsuD/methylene tetrahydromethanopterin reductase-like flavin-dependent oxidoreductase (luciferase family)
MASGGSDIETFERNVPLLRAALEEAGRDAAAFPVSKRVYFAMQTDQEASGRTAESGPRPVVWRSEDECMEYLQRLIRAGVTHVLLNPVSDFEQQLEAVLPSLRRVGAAA